MGAYRYCVSCGAGLAKPSLSDIRDDQQTCQACGYDNGLLHNKHAALCEYVEDLEEILRARLDALEGYES